MRTRAAAAAALAGFLLAGLLATGCARQPASPPQAPEQACVQVGVDALTGHVTLTSLPVPCRKLTAAQRSYAAAAAADAVASAGIMRGKTLMRARRRELSPLLPHPAASPAAGSGQGAARAASQTGGIPARLAALAAWVVTVALGLSLMARWFARRRGRSRRFRPAMNLAHLGLALAGLAVWISYLATGLAGLAWAGCVLLLPVAGLGMSLLVLRLAGRSPRATGVTAAHVAAAVVTMLLTLLAAVGSG
ncbi:MAG: hypothetical protein J2P34_06610 [Actinobacteria bacterium]|nr:hypothetical protein [Actinomycetota bacterium]